MKATQKHLYIRVCKYREFLNGLAYTVPVKTSANSSAVHTVKCSLLLPSTPYTIFPSELSDSMSLNLGSWFCFEDTEIPHFPSLRVV